MLTPSELQIITRCAADLHAIMRAHEDHAGRIAKEEAEAKEQLRRERLQREIDADLADN